MRLYNSNALQSGVVLLWIAYTIIMDCMMRRAVLVKRTS